MQSLDKIQKDKYRALFILGAIGDAVGYKRGRWEFNKSGAQIHKQFNKITGGKGMEEFEISQEWICSDDTIMHIATAEALKQIFNNPLIETGKAFAQKYVECFNYMEGRAPGITTSQSINFIQRNIQNWKLIQYNQCGGGCGAAMRTACIGAVYRNDLRQLVRISIEASRITHNNAIAYLGGVTSAYFTYLALVQIDIRLWAAKLLFQCIPIAKDIIKEQGKQNQIQSRKHWDYFIQKWQQYIKQRKLSRESEPPREPFFPHKYGVQQRELFYKSVSYRGWGGSSGHDSVIIAYDALLGCKGDWNEFCLRGVLHGGDNDSTGAIGGSWFGALYGMKQIPQKNYQNLQQVRLLETEGSDIFQIHKKKNG